MSPTMHSATWWKSLALTFCMLLAFSQSVSAADRGVHGRVLGLDEKGKPTGPVIGATVTLLNAAGAVSAETQSAEGGYYRLEADPGRYTFKVVAEGYKDEDEGRGIELQLSDRYAVFNFSLSKGANDPNRKRPDQPTTGVGQLSGHVLWTEEGQYPEGVPGAVISLKGPDNALMLIQTVSRSENRKTSELAGGYDVTLAAGKWRASVVAEGFETLIEDAPIEITADNSIAHDFVLKKKTPPEIRNQGIRVRVTHTDVFSGDEVPPPSQVFVIFELDPNQLGNPLQPGGPGFFQRNLPVGRYRAVVMGDGYQTSWSPPVEVFRGRYTLVDLELSLRPEVMPLPDVLDSHGIRGFVKIADPQMTPDSVSVEKVLEQTEVYIVPADVSSTLTNPLSLDEGGAFSRALPIGGPYKVIAIVRDYEPASVEASVAPGAYSDVELILRRKIQATPPPMGLVLNAVVFGQAAEGAEKQPLPDANVLLRAPNTPLSEAPRAITDSNGRVHFDLSSPGVHAILAQKEGYRPRGARITISDTEPNTAEIILTRNDPEDMPVSPILPSGREPAVVRGYVVMRDASEPTGIKVLPGAKLQWSRLDVNQSQPAETIAQQSGQFQMDLPVGLYGVDVSPPPDMQRKVNGVREKVTVVHGMPPKYFFLPPLTASPPAKPPALTPSGKVIVRGFVVTESNGRFQAVPGALLTWSQGITQSLPAATSDSSGQFSLSLNPGNYNVAIRAPAGLSDGTEQVLVKAGMEPQYFVLTRPSAAPEPPVPALAALDVRVLEPNPLRPPQPLPNATVTLLQNDQVAARSRTNRLGFASFRLKPGSYEIQTAVTGFETDNGVLQLNPGRVSFDVYLRRTRRPGAEPGPTPVPMPVTATLNVQVGTVDRNGGNKVQLLSGAQVGITMDGVPIAAGTTNRFGVYSAQLKPGTYQVSASYQLLKTEQDIVQVTGGVLDHRILLRPASPSIPKPAPQNSAVLQLQVGGVNPRGGNKVVLLGDASVIIRQGKRTIDSGVTDRNGTYTADLAPGSYEVEAKAAGYYDGTVAVKASVGTVEQRILLKPKLKIQ